MSLGIKTKEIRTHPNFAQKAYIIYYSEVTKLCKKDYRARNIKDFLVKSDTYVRDGIDGHVSKDVGFYPCLKCASCKNVRKRCFEFRSCITDRTYKIKQLVTCASTNVIYLLFCPCIKQYVGKTNRQFRTRIIEHMSAIRRKDLKSPVARHFVDMSHSVLYLNFVVIEKLTQTRRGGNLERRLLQKECRWIFYLKSLHPLGMNEDLSLNCFL